MIGTSSIVTVAFCLVVAGVAACLAAGTWRASRSVGRSHDETRRATASVIVGTVVFLSATGLLASTGVLADFSGKPPNMLRLLVPCVVAAGVLAYSRFGSLLAEGVPLAALVGFQSFRLAVEAILFALHREGALPVEMTFEGMNFDVVSGASALLLAVVLVRRPVARVAVLAWNAIALGLLVVVVVVAALSMPTALRAFDGEPPLTLPARVPFVWLPTFLVTSALFGHLLVFRAVAARRKSSQAGSPSATIPLSCRGRRRPWRSDS